MIFETSQMKQGESAIITSPTIVSDNSQDLCINFWYYISQDGVASIAVLKSVSVSFSFNVVLMSKYS